MPRHEKIDENLVIQYFFVILHRVPFIRHKTFYLLNFPAELRPRKGFNRAKPIYYWSCATRRLLHKYIEVVANLAGNMAGLRFSLYRS